MRGDAGGAAAVLVAHEHRLDDLACVLAFRFRLVKLRYVSSPIWTLDSSKRTRDDLRRLFRTLSIVPSRPDNQSPPTLKTPNVELLNRWKMAVAQLVRALHRAVRRALLGNDLTFETIDTLSRRGARLDPDERLFCVLAKVRIPMENRKETRVRASSACGATHAASRSPESHPNRGLKSRPN